MKPVLQACAHISNHLDHTKTSSKADDDWIEAQMRKVGPIASGADASVPASRINEYFW